MEKLVPGDKVSINVGSLRNPQMRDFTLFAVLPSRMIRVYDDDIGEYRVFPVTRLAPEKTDGK